ncbi:hypothetical protein HmCmsJML001_02752 [Escherichia coli]|nr:hypothetical protein HmCmsJML001_02752 [Escherichia coli]
MKNTEKGLEGGEEKYLEKSNETREEIIYARKK